VCGRFLSLALHKWWAAAATARRQQNLVAWEILLSLVESSRQFFYQFNQRNCGFEINARGTTRTAIRNKKKGCERHSLISESCVAFLIQSDFIKKELNNVYDFKSACERSTTALGTLHDWSERISVLKRNEIKGLKSQSKTQNVTLRKTHTKVQCGKKLAKFAARVNLWMPEIPFVLTSLSHSLTLAWCNIIIVGWFNQNPNRLCRSS